MSKVIPKRISSLPQDLQQQIDRVCQAFVRSWQAGRQPRIEDQLNSAPTGARECLLRQLILTEQQLRRHTAVPANLAEFLSRFPDYDGLVHDVFQGHGDNPSTTCDRFPAPVRSGRQRPAQKAALPLQVGRYVIRSRLGRGAYGDVYLAHDPDIDRLVALKVPRPERFASQAALDGFLREARLAARLHHPGIVKVYDVNRDSGNSVIVLEYVEGRTLAQAISTEQFSCERIVELLIEIADAVNDANEDGLVHRDLKPSNVLIDQRGRPRVTDFGLAVHEDTQRLRNLRSAGTPAYMAPEQVRGETHRLDGRTDQWSLGVILYEMLTGRRPFRGDTRAELFDEIKHRSPKPPRQIVPSIPAELERICLKCLSQRMPDRYTTLRDLAGELRDWLKDSRRSRAGLLTGACRTSEPVERPTKVIPRGLRSFDQHDADFFLELLPGPRDRDGLPDSLRFWKLRIEERDADNTFSVGLIYGPSGCGKSSLVKAGLLPVLSESVCGVYIEATPDDTETQLLKRLRKHFPDLPENLSLPETCAALREGRGITGETKALIVLDQFEQWLHSRCSESDSQLLDALRHCDGSRLQCIVMVRDDFWLAVSRFMKELEVPIAENENSALVDLFDLGHARHVLAQFGRSFGQLPEDRDRTTEGQHQFLDHAVQDLAESGKVVCVRLALFAQTMKDKDWLPGTLVDMGGTQGVGETFLGETFSSSTAPPECRRHQKAARAVLDLLLPEAGTQIKGHMRPYADVVAASGYIDNPADVETLIRILDRQLRLITPTDRDGIEIDGGNSNATVAESTAVYGEADSDRTQQYFQLTHDYLVPSLRNWLTRKQRETLGGRAALKLADRTALWKAHRERRQLPSYYEWFVIRLLTSKRQWTESERTMMAEAGRQRTMPVLLLLAIFAIAGGSWWVYEQTCQRRADQLVSKLRTASTREARETLQEIESYRRWVNDSLYNGLSDAIENQDPRQELHFRFALAPIDKSQVKPMLDLLLKVEPGDFVFLSNRLWLLREDLRESLWVVLENPDRYASAEILRAAAALQICDQWCSERWDSTSMAIVEALIQLYTTEPKSATAWIIPLKQLAVKLRQPLEIIQDGNDATRQKAATQMLLTLFPD